MFNYNLFNLSKQDSPFFFGKYQPVFIEYFTVNHVD